MTIFWHTGAHRKTGILVNFHLQDPPWLGGYYTSPGTSRGEKVSRGETISAFPTIANRRAAADVSIRGGNSSRGEKLFCVLLENMPNGVRNPTISMDLLEIQKIGIRRAAGTRALGGKDSSRGEKLPGFWGRFFPPIRIFPP